MTNRIINNKHKQLVVKFTLLCMVMVGYFAYLSYEYNMMTGGIASMLTWGFFVLCTPIADAGFLIDFPLRILFGIRMVISEIVVWALAILINIVSIIYFAQYYQTTLITKLMYKIIVNPYPFWGIILLSGIGTFLSIHFGDKLMDIIDHRDRNFLHSPHFKHELMLGAFLILVFVGYYELLINVGIEI